MPDQPNNQNQNPSSENNSSTPQENQDPTLTLVTNNETPTPEATPVSPQQPNTDLATLWHGVASDNARRAQQAEERAQQLEQRLSSLEQQRSAPAPEQLREQYFADPVGTLRQEMQQLVAPINTQLQQFTRAQQLQNAIASMASDQRFRYLRVPDFYNWFMQQANSVQNVNADTLATVYSSLVGYVAINAPQIFQQLEALTSGNAQQQQPNNQPPVNNQPQNTQQQPPRSQVVGNNPNVQTPPHLRPQNPNPPSAPQVASREYTENEKRIMRERGMTPAEYDRLLSAGPLVSGWKPQGA